MAGGRGRRGAEGQNFWPGYVDILSTLLLVVTFLMSLFMLAQYFVSKELSGKDTALKRLTEQISQLTELLSLERGSKKSIEEELAAMTSSLTLAENEKKQLAVKIGESEEAAKSAAARSLALEGDLGAQKSVACRRAGPGGTGQPAIAGTATADRRAGDRAVASESKDKESQTKIADLGNRLNVALAKKVQELNEYRSEFFGRLKELLKDRKDIQVVGDRFVFQAEVLFPSGSDQVNPQGLSALSSWPSPSANSTARFQMKSTGYCGSTVIPTCVRSRHRCSAPTGSFRRRGRSPWSSC